MIRFSMEWGIQPNEELAKILFRRISKCLMNDALDSKGENAWKELSQNRIGFVDQNKPWYISIYKSWLRTSRGTGIFFSVFLLSGIKLLRLMQIRSKRLSLFFVRINFYETRIFLKNFL